MTASDQKRGRLRYLIPLSCFVLGWIVNVGGPFLIWRLFEIHSDFVFPGLGYSIMAAGGLFFLVDSFKHEVRRPDRPEALRQELEQVIQRAAAEPEKAKPAWDLARVRLELYFDRNLSQINSIFWLSVGVMVVGFILILYGISKALVPIPQCYYNR